MNNSYFSAIYINHLKTSYPYRSYYGKANNECQHCGALFWYEDRKKSVCTKVTYSSCCKEGKIKLPPFNNPPEIYNRYSLIYTMFKYFWLQNDQIIVL